MVTSTPKGTRRDETAPQPWQFVPQPSATDPQALSKAWTARAAADVSVSQGDHAQIMISANPTRTIDEDLLSIISPFPGVGLLPGDNSNILFLIKILPGQDFFHELQICYNSS